MKIYTLPPKEDWIVDRFVKEWQNDNSDITCDNASNSDAIWLLADWCWNRIDYNILLSKCVVTTVHHIVPEKFTNVAHNEFIIRDRITNVYHTPNEKTAEFISKLTDKPIVVIPYWANQKIWKKTLTKESARTKYSIPNNKFIIGSFQRDTEGSDLISPKLEKGPDLLCDYIEFLNKKHSKNIHVVLAGWRRQYVISRLQQANIQFSYFEKPQHEVVNELYQTLDLYPVSARYEGGPQSLIECGLLDIDVVTRDVGMANTVFSHAKTAVNNNLELAIPAKPNVDALKLPDGYKQYRELFNSLFTLKQ